MKFIQKHFFDWFAKNMYEKSVFLFTPIIVGFHFVFHKTLNKVTACISEVFCISN